ncbi:type I restriction-modification system endonuclease [Stieleria sp. ICT_E10.1]|uniref:type I restriction-modification system endonuclease n=1 Tax=Stieleria sedimenti TaxID=2976331 RepID=UPI002180984B|nr:type I restriction-modification system endonuclease [Stieleria sedimenti]MCS7469563.1 type I restriction-modification system endonuclease [Stieleria sedimenti]
MTSSDSGALRSPNFQFLHQVDPLLVDLGARAERYALDDPNTSIIKIRQLGELLAQSVAAKYGIDTMLDSRPKDQRTLIDDLFRSRALPADVKNLFHEIRKEGNQANHAMKGDQGRAITLLRYARQAAVWFYRTHVDKSAKLGPFVPPLPKQDTTDESKQELARLKKLYEDATAAQKQLQDQAADEAQLRQMAEEDRERAFQELEAAIALVEEESAATDAKIAEYEKQLAALSEATKPTETEAEAMVAAGEQVANEELTEADTRELIDIQLREAGWTVDSKNIRFGKGSRPQKNKNIAIAEWPTTSGPADYVLFVGLTPLAVVEAKRKNVDVAGAITQSKRYSCDYTLSADELSPGGPWGEYNVPFLFSTNGRGYLKQLKTKSGVWFLDARRSINHPRPLVSWYTPQGLKQLLGQDVDEAQAKLDSESTDYLPLRFYQEDAVKAVEDAIKAGEREMLVAMATGTGKTRTCIGICYRLIKAKRFRRILFLVDRTSLGEQTVDALRDVRIENNQTFADIYDVKELGDLRPDQDTKFHIATIQGMVKRLLDSENGGRPLPVDQYDCIVVDECHRGYNLDQELTDSELSFRDEADYISKYSRVLEYFDAVKIGLTATPAVHTLEIFGGTTDMPIYQYSYRQAVLDGFLVDHEPPLQIKTRLAQDGIKWQVNEEVAVYDTKKDQLKLFHTPDEISLEIDSFNRRVVNENFNRVICEELAKHIDPTLPGKTLIYCVTDMHADMVVDELKRAFTNQYGAIEDEAVKKITGKSDKPSQLIRRFKNEKYPSVGITVDLLTTGIDVPEICNLVFLRRVRSRILYEQMLGRGTRLCEDLHGPGEDKACFHIFDCVDLYSALESYTDMKPVVTKPNITFAQLLDELAKTKKGEHREVIKEQLVAKLQRKKRSLKGKKAQALEDKSGLSPQSLVNQIRAASPDEIVEWFADKSNLIEFLDKATSGDGARFFVSEHDDEVTGVASGFGKGNKRPKDYLEEFREFVVTNQDQIAAIKLCATKPRDLTRQALRELQLELDRNGFSETRLKVAWRETKNVEIAATIIGYIRNAILDAPLEPFEDRVKAAMTTILASRNWTKPQRQWLERIGKQFKENTLVDRDAIDQGQFKEYGGFDRLNKIFDGHLADLLGLITDQIWGVAA